MEPNQEQHDDADLVLPPRAKGRLGRWVLLFVGVGLFGVLVAGLFIRQLNLPATTFPVGQPVTIAPGTTVREITEQMESAGVVRSALLLYMQLALYHDTTKIIASTYVFDAPLTSEQVADRLTEGDFDTNLVRLTHIEGERASILAARAEMTLSEFNSESFTVLAEPHEGKLFPETYFIPEDYTEEELLALLLATFEEFIDQHRAEIVTHPLELPDILTLASIIEREANSPESMRLVSGILQNRLEIDMPLQADASIEYVLDKPLSELTPEDLEIDSPYNTYTNLGLPPTPIGNPGREAILAVLAPAETEYFYYLTDEEGEFHYARTYDEHLRNIERYLR